jgi:hypothetical protein
VNNNNESFSSIEVCGQVIGNLEFSHEWYGEKYYRFFVGVQRLSGVIDELPVIISERLMGEEISHGRYVRIKGSVRTKNKQTEEGKNKLLVNIHAEHYEIEKSDDGTNNMAVCGCICGKANYRITPETNRAIADFMLCVYRKYGVKDYIPCIAWGKNATYISKMEPWNEITAIGRFQSRNYIKVVNGVKEMKMTYEMSISGFEESEVLNEQE